MTKQYETKDDGTKIPEQGLRAQIAQMEQMIMRSQPATDWLKHFDDTDRRRIANCRSYAKNDPAGMPGHNLMIIIDKMARLLETAGTGES